MQASIPDASWQIEAADPTALTRILGVSDLVVTCLRYDALQARLHFFCQHAHQSACCPTCGHRSSAVHQSQKRRVRDLPWAGKECLLEFSARRFFCEGCRCPFREELAWLPRHSRLTVRYQAYVFEQCRRTSIQAVHQKERLGYKAVQRLYYRQAQTAGKTHAAVLVGRLGIDEIALKKGHDAFVLVLSDLHSGRVLALLPDRKLALLPDRKKETLLAHFARWTPEQRAAITEVARDLWEPYAQAVQSCLPHAKIVADRFHVMKLLNEQVSKARRDLQRQMPEETRSQLKGVRWLLVRNFVELSADEKVRLKGMFEVAPILGQLHAFKEDFRAIFEADIPRETANWRLWGWINKVERSALTPLATFVNTLRRRLGHILNYFPNRLSSGRVEGLNTKLKLIKRCAYGFTNFAHFAWRVLVECDGAT